VSRDAKKRLARAKAAGFKTPNFRRRGLEAADALDKRAVGQMKPVAEKLQALAAGIRGQLAP
jgi:hypothetical protein